MRNIIDEIFALILLFLIRLIGGVMLLSLILLVIKS